MPFKEFGALKSGYEQYRRFLYSVAGKIANSKDNRNEFEKVILKKIMVYKIYKASKTDNEDSEMNKSELIELATVYGRLNINCSFYSEFLNIVIEILSSSKPKIKESIFSEKIEIIKKMLSFAR